MSWVIARLRAGDSIPYKEGELRLREPDDSYICRLELRLPGTYSSGVMTYVQEIPFDMICDLKHGADALEFVADDMHKKLSREIAAAVAENINRDIMGDSTLAYDSWERRDILAERDGVVDHDYEPPLYVREKNSPYGLKTPFSIPESRACDTPPLIKLEGGFIDGSI